MQTGQSPKAKRLAHTLSATAAQTPLATPESQMQARPAEQPDDEEHRRKHAGTPVLLEQTPSLPPSVPQLAPVLHDDEQTPDTPSKFC
jgi:hypothetical protein